MKFKSIMLTEMSRASDRRLGKDSLENILYILRDYAKSDPKPTWRRLANFTDEYGIDWNKVAAVFNVKPEMRDRQSKVDLALEIPYIAKQNKINLNTLSNAVNLHKDTADYLIDLFWDYFEAKRQSDQDLVDDIVSRKEFKLLVDWVQSGKTLKEFGVTDGDSSNATAEEAFGRHYDKVINYLKPYTMGDSYAGSPEEAIEEFWNWHRAKKAGKEYTLDKDILERLAKILEADNAIDIIGEKGLHFYMAKEVGRMLDRKLRFPGEDTPLQKELKRIMDALDNPEYIDQIEKEEKKRLSSANTYTAGLGGGHGSGTPSFGFDMIPAATLRKIADIAAEDGAVDKEKVGKLDKSQVKECFRYCMNQLNRKFHVGQRGAFEGTLQEFYDKFKIIFTRGYTTKTLFRILDEVTTFMVDQLDKETAEYWKNKEEIVPDDDFNESTKAMQEQGYEILSECDNKLYNYESDIQRDVCQKLYDLYDFDLERAKSMEEAYKEAVREFKNIYSDVDTDMIPKDPKDFEKKFGRSISG